LTQVPPAGQLLNPESLPLLLESTYAKAGLLVPESSTSGTTPEADMFYGALAGIKFMPPPQSINFCHRLQIASLRNPLEITEIQINNIQGTYRMALTSSMSSAVLHLAKQLHDPWSFFSQCMNGWNKTELCVGKLAS